MKVFTLILFVLFTNVHADLYQDILNDSPSLGSYQKGEIEIITDSTEIREIEELQQSRWIKKGFSETDSKLFSSTGVITEDPYWIWIRDPVRFPSGHQGTYDRLVLKNSKNMVPGSGVLAVTGDKKVAVTVCYRHATRSWEVELPRGARKTGETYDQTAVRELKEETGLVADSTYHLGSMAPDSGCLSCIVPIFLAKVKSKGLPTPELTEAISVTLFVEVDDLCEAIQSGYLKYKNQDIPVRDSFLTYAILQAKLKNLL